MFTEFGELTLNAVRAKIAEFDEIGEGPFLDKYANGRGARSTWIVSGGNYYPAKAVFAAALKPSVLPREFNTSDTYVFADTLNFSPSTGLELIRFDSGEISSDRSAINDLDDANGADLPIRHQFSGARFARDGKIRSAALQRANGVCEHCGTAGFKTHTGSAYLETHHIISLAKQGPDSLDNVIALCPNDHRRAHFGADWVELETQFKAKLAKMQKKG